MYIGVYSRDLSNSLSLETFLTVASILEKHQIEMRIYEKTAEKVKTKKVNITNYKTFSICEKNSSDNPSLVLSIGGDGTILDTLMIVRNTGTPVLGINAGRLGFLTATSQQNVELAINSFVQGNYIIEERSLIELETSTGLFGYNFALNDFVIMKKDSSSMIKVHTYLNGEYFNSYWSDGLICSTPTGSTGYNLSCGGPILHPQSRSFAITPIAPHNLNVRPFVIADNHVLSFEVEGRSKGFLASMDSRSVTITPDVKMAIKRADFSLKLVRLEGETFMNALRSKMMWGVDVRN